MLPCGVDSRVPMAEILGLFTGSHTVSDVFRAVEACGPDASETKDTAIAYASLYCGLYLEALGMDEAVPDALVYLSSQTVQLCPRSCICTGGGRSIFSLLIPSRHRWGMAAVCRSPQWLRSTGLTPHIQYGRCSDAQVIGTTLPHSFDKRPSPTAGAFMPFTCASSACRVRCKEWIPLGDWASLP